MGCSRFDVTFRYLIRRVLGAVPLLIGVSLIIFAILHLAPGDPLSVYAENPAVTQEALDNIRASLGLDRPLPEQYVRWFTSFLRGEWGYSIRTNRPAFSEALTRLPATIKLSGTAFLLALVVALPLGIVSAVKRYSWVDHTATLFSFLGISTPVFWLALMVQLLFAVELRWLPSAGMSTVGDDSFMDQVRHLILPATVLSFAFVAGWSRYVRSSMIEVLGLDYVRTARAKGLREWAVVNRHALKNALIPVITVIALDAATLFSGAVITETIFAWPGLGRLFVESMTGRDYPVLLGLLMFGSFGLIFINLLTDLLYASLDPRVRYA
jgi:peptide/nickel transport system permease protein